MSKLSKKNSHEKDQHINFKEELHEYYLKGVKLDTSVTTFIHEFFEKFDAKKIIEKYYNRWQENENSPYYEMAPDEIIDLWEKNREKQAQAGTDMHLAIEMFYNGENIDDNTKEFNHFKRFYEEHKHLIPYRTEWVIYAEELSLAGSIDMTYIKNNKLHIYDWKRSKEIKEQNKWQSGKYPLTHLPDTNFWHYSLQLNCYKAILENYYNMEVEEMYLVVLHPNNENYIKLKVPNLQKEIKDLFNIRKNNIN